ncbi:zinc finger CCCH domain-containing protein 54-like [Zingiber officinale]|uniref:Zinc finger CCCH domain-containing protein 18-like n=1 Tax=Zingiber officinale TaxID=94328 RepID=A0A8J5CE37_ZINOF|nr:zinc finger CCCH domain-containing protein 54-like [Zingiber officinale]KAG6474071.1 hypothetical protein ZIOFF_067995 [Zingiber officinale]
MVIGMEAGETRYYDMDFFELAKIIFGKVQKLEPENVAKIMGCIFLKEPSEQEMIQLAYGPEHLLLLTVNDAKSMLNVLYPKNFMPDFRIGSYPPFESQSSDSSCNNFRISTSHWNTRLAQNEHHASSHSFDLSPFSDLVGDKYSFHTRTQSMEPLDGAPSSHIANFCPDTALPGGMATRFNRRSHSFCDLPIKACYYFSKGYCKHGTNCRYSHAQSFPDGFPHAHSTNMQECPIEDNTLTPRSLEKLEFEISELLKSKRGMPVSIASLPMLYFEKFGKNLQAEGYLTESQRHGKAGYNLTKLLYHLRKSIRLIERPHGQHSVILAEDAPRYREGRNERIDLSPISSSSHQIYLTFPAESTFTDEDVSDYFKQYGQVHDVRIPCQEKRMFGFVSFVHPETVNIVLMKRNPHYICGARVLVKPYKEKTKTTLDRSYTENSKPILQYHSNHHEMDRDAHSVLQESESARLLRYQQLIDKNEMLERERTPLSGMNLACTAVAQQHYLTPGVDDLKTLEGPNQFSLNHFGYEFDLLNNGTTIDSKTRHTSEQESDILKLPDSPFASLSLASRISAVL